MRPADEKQAGVKVFPPVKLPTDALAAAERNEGSPTRCDKVSAKLQRWPLANEGGQHDPQRGMWRSTLTQLRTTAVGKGKTFFTQRQEYPMVKSGPKLAQCDGQYGLCAWRRGEGQAMTGSRSISSMRQENHCGVSWARNPRRAFPFFAKGR